MSDRPHISLVDFKAKFDQIIYADIKKKAKNISGFDHQLSMQVVSHIQSILLSGGKRLRPYIAYSAYKAAGGRDSIKNLGSVLIALEYFHLFALIHDDIIDKAQVRHGIPTVEKYVSNLTGDDLLANRVAILAGDMVYGWSNDLIARYVSPGKNHKSRILQKEFSYMTQEIVIGQITDVEMMHTQNTSFEAINKKNHYKSALYTCIRPMFIGFHLANKNISPKIKKIIHKYGTSLGQAFQLQDDLLDIIGSSDVIGKNNFSDIEDGQHTYITEFVRQYGTDRDKEVLISLFGKPLSSANKVSLRELFSRVGAIEATKEIIKENIDQAYKYARLLPCSSIWINLINIISARKF